MRTLKFYLFIFYSTFVFSAQQMVVDSSNSVIVRFSDGSEQYLNGGDVIEVLDPENWKRNIRIIKTTNPLVTKGPAVIGNNQYLSLVGEGHLKVQGNTTVAPNTFVVNGPIEVELPDKKKVILEDGDVIVVGAKDGWKRKVTIISSKGGYKSEAVLGDQTFSKYKLENVVSPKVATTPRVIAEQEDELDLLFKRFSFPEKDEDVVEPVEEAIYVNTDCPEQDKVFKLQKATSIIGVPGKYDTIPEGSIVKTKRTEKGVCRLSVQKLPEGSKLNISNFPSVAATYPSNMGEFNLEEIEDPTNIINLEKGVSFKLPEGASVRAIGRRTGKAYNFSSSDKVEIVGLHPNGSYIVKRNGERFEYRIDKNTLDELNELGALNINFRSTMSDIVRNDSFNQTVQPEEPECSQDNVNEVVDTYADDEDFESCREKTIKGKKSTLKPNNYLFGILDFGNESSQHSPSLVARYTECIGKSMLRGTSNNAAPTCKKDKDGNVIPQKIRERVKNSKGKFYNRLADRRPRACANKKTAEYLAKNFLSAASCLGLDPMEFFPVINHESHFQPTAVSPTFATGIGQIIPKTYNDFYQAFNQSKSYIDRNHSMAKKIQKLSNARDYEDYEKNNRPVRRLTAYMLAHVHDKVKSSDPNCAGLNRMYKEPYLGKTHADVVKQENVRLCAPSNPSEDFFISMIMYMQNKKYSMYVLNEINKVSRKKMPKSKIDEFSKILSRWMYNGGENGIYTVFELFAKDLSHNRVEELASSGRVTGKKLSNKSLADLSADEFKRYFSHYLKYQYSSDSSSRRNEVATYVPGTGGTGGIDGDLDLTEGRGRRECGN